VGFVFTRDDLVEVGAVAEDSSGAVLILRDVASPTASNERHYFSVLIEESRGVPQGVLGPRQERTARRQKSTWLWSWDTRGEASPAREQGGGDPMKHPMSQHGNAYASVAPRE